MSAYSFVEVRKYIAEVATTHGINVSSRRIKAVAGQWITQSEQELDGDTGGRTILYADPTGDAAVENVLALLRAA